MLYFENLKVGDKFRTPEHTLTEEEIIAFGRQFDPQAFHTDAEAAKTTLFGRLVASVDAVAVVHTTWSTLTLRVGLELAALCVVNAAVVRVVCAGAALSALAPPHDRVWMRA